MDSGLSAIEVNGRGPQRRKLVEVESVQTLKLPNLTPKVSALKTQEIIFHPN